MTQPESTLPQAEIIARSNEALRHYHATDVSVPVGGLPPLKYEQWRRNIEDDALSPAQYLERGWLELEYGMAMMRGGIDVETEEPYDHRKIAGTFESARQYFTRLAKNDAAPLYLRAQARLSAISVFMHQEVVTGKPPSTQPEIHVATPKVYLPFLRGLHAVATELLADGDAPNAECAEILAMIGIIAPLNAQVFKHNWYLPSAPRQPWDVTMHSSTRTRPDMHAVIDREPTSEYDLTIRTLELTPQDNKDPLLLAKEFVRLGPEYASIDKKITWFWAINYTLVDQMNDHLDYLETLGVQPADEVIEEAARPPETVRDVLPEAIWYLTEYTAQTSSQELAAYVRQLEVHRRELRLLPDEQRVLGWMQLELAQALSLEAANQAQLDAARDRFADAMDTFVRAQRMFMRADQPGDALDAVLAQTAAEVYRAFYTSRAKDGSIDAYAVRRAIASYHDQVAAIFASANKIKAHDEQVAALKHMIRRATLILLQGAANEELRHLILPVSPRFSDQQDAIALHMLGGHNVSNYDVAEPISVLLGPGNDITAGYRRITVGVDILAVSGGSVELLKELTNLLRSGKTNAAIGKKAGKIKGNKQTKAGNTARSERVQQLSVQLANAVSDAYEMPES